MMPMTGPKLSSTMTAIEWSTLTSTCGAMYGVPGCLARPEKASRTALGSCPVYGVSLRFSHAPKAGRRTLSAGKSEVSISGLAPLATVPAGEQSAAVLGRTRRKG